MKIEKLTVPMRNAQKFSLFILLMVLSISFSGCGKLVKNDKKDQESKDTKTEEEKAAEKKRSLRIQKLKKIKAEAKKRFDLEMKKEQEFDEEEARRQLLLEKYAIDLNTIPKERKSTAEIIEFIQKEAHETANVRFPDEKRQSVIDEAKKEFPLYEVGALVEVKTIRGAIYGILERIYPEKIKVEKHYILLDDIISPPSACFNKLRCQKRRDHFVRANFDVLKDDFKNKCVKDFTPKIYKEEGYVSVKSQWVPVENLIKKKIDPLVQKMKTSYYAKLEKEVKKRVELQMSKEGFLPVNE